MTLLGSVDADMAVNPTMSSDRKGRGSSVQRRNHEERGHLVRVLTCEENAHAQVPLGQLLELVPGRDFELLPLELLHNGRGQHVLQ